MTHLDTIAHYFERDTGFPLKEHLILLALSGSRAYNLHTETSDYDYVGIVVPPARHITGLGTFEGWEPKAGMLPDGLDVHIYSIDKAIRLLLDGNPNMLEMLWYPKGNYLVQTFWGTSLLYRREIFSSKKSYKSLTGYAKAQFYRMTQGLGEDRDWAYYTMLIELAGWTREAVLAEAPRGMPNVDAVATYIESQPDFLGHFRDEHHRKDVVTGTLKRAGERLRQIHKRRNNEDSARLAMRARIGYDAKNASHLLRLLTMGLHFAKTNQLNPWMEGEVREQILGVKRGEYPLDAVKACAEIAGQAADHAFATCTLPEDADRAGAEQLLMTIQRRSLEQDWLKGAGNVLFA